jgi:hypothetical protein
MAFFYQPKTLQNKAAQTAEKTASSGWMNIQNIAEKVKRLQPAIEAAKSIGVPTVSVFKPKEYKESMKQPKSTMTVYTAPKVQYKENPLTSALVSPSNKEIDAAAFSMPGGTMDSGTKKTGQFLIIAAGAIIGIYFLTKKKGPKNVKRK